MRKDDCQFANALVCLLATTTTATGGKCCLLSPSLGVQLNAAHSLFFVMAPSRIRVRGYVSLLTINSLGGTLLRSTSHSLAPLFQTTKRTPIRSTKKSSSPEAVASLALLFRRDFFQFTALVRHGCQRWCEVCMDVERFAPFALCLPLLLDVC